MGSNGNRQRVSMIVAVGLGLAGLGISGCSSTENGLASNVRKTDIAWLTTELQNDGVFVRERGNAGRFIPSTTSSRLVLDGQEILDVYEFSEYAYAADQAYQFAEQNPGSDVYLKQAIVVVRYSRRDTGLSQTLNSLLGRTL